MAALKALVVVMGLMILGGLALLGAVIAGRLAHRAAPVAAPQSFTAAPLKLPSGARIDGFAAGSGRLVIEVALPDGGRRFVIIDLATGRRLGTIPVAVAR